MDERWYESPTILGVGAVSMYTLGTALLIGSAKILAKSFRKS